jgi:methyl-accepting chemotaxis protein
MFKVRSISARLILAISLTVASTCAVLGVFSIVQQRSLTRLALDEQLKLQYDSIIAAIDYEGRSALAVGAVVASLPPVADAVAKGDRGALLALLSGAQTALEAQGIPRVSFMLPPANVLVRVNRADRGRLSDPIAAQSTAPELHGRRDESACGGGVTATESNY